MVRGLLRAVAARRGVCREFDCWVAASGCRVLPDGAARAVSGRPLQVRQGDAAAVHGVAAPLRRHDALSPAYTSGDHRAVPPLRGRCPFRVSGGIWPTHALAGDRSLRLRRDDRRWTNRGWDRHRVGSVADSPFKWIYSGEVIALLGFGFGWVFRGFLLSPPPDPPPLVDPAAAP